MWHQEGRGMPNPNDNSNQWQQQQEYYQQQQYYGNYYGEQNPANNDPAIWAQKAAEWIKHKESVSHRNNDLSGQFAHGGEMGFDGRHPSHFYPHDANFEQDRLQQSNVDHYNYSAMSGNEILYDNESSQHMQHAPVIPVGPDGMTVDQAPYYNHYPEQDLYGGAPNAADSLPNPHAPIGYGYDQYNELTAPVGLQPDASHLSASAAENNKKKTLPLWLRQSLEKLEKDKQKKSQQENLNASFNKSDKLSTSLNYSGYAFEASPMNSPSPIQEAESAHSDSEAYNTDEKTEALSSANIVKEHCLQSEQNLLVHVRKILTEVLLEVTDEMIQSIANENLQITKSATATVLASSSALAALEGLGAYDQDSDEDDDNSAKTRIKSSTTPKSEDNANDVNASFVREGEAPRRESDSKPRSRRSSNDKSNQEDYSKRNYHTHHRSRRRSRSRSRSYSPRRRRSRSPDSRRTSHSDKYKSSRHHRDLSSSPEYHRYRKKSVRK